MAKKVEEKNENVKTSNKNVHEIIVKFDGDKWSNAIDNAFKVKQKEAKVDGFRKGKVPRDIYEKHYGKESLFFPAAEGLLQDAYKQAMEDCKLVPVVQPSVDIKSIDENSVEFLFKIVTKPELNIKKYKGLSIKCEEVEVKQEEVDHEIGHILEEYQELVTKDGKVENGDIAIIDFEGFKDGVAFDGGKGENYSLEIGSNTFIPGFEEQVIGMAAGSEKDINVVFPEDYASEDLKGCPAVFHVKVNEIKEKKERELDEDLFLDLGIEGVNSKETLEDTIRKEIQARKEMDAENQYVDKILGEVAKNVEVDIPQEMVDEESERLLNRFAQQMQMQGISLDLYYQFTKSTEADLRGQIEPEAYQNVLYRLMLEEIMNLEKIEVSVEDAEKEAQELADKYQVSKEEFLKQFGGIDMIQYDLEMRKTIDLLKELNK